jgi:hypothetical protein
MKFQVLRLGWPQWALVMAIVVMVIPAVVVLLVSNQFDLWLITRFELPGFEKTLGFKTEHVKLPSDCGGDLRVLVIAEVVKGSPFEQAGVLPGDIPRGSHGGESEFLWGLVWGKSRGSVKLHLTPLEAASRGDWKVEREVVVTFPATTKVPPA